MSAPKKVLERLVAGTKKFQPIIAAAKARDVNESDTVILATDILAEIFGYSKYGEITSEYAVKSTYCDLAIKLDGGLQLLLEVKAIGIGLKDNHVKQAIDYAANQGTDWVVLTNGEVWRVYKLIFAKPIDSELVLEINLSAINPKSEADLDLLYTLSKEGWQKSALGEFHEQKQVLSRFSIGAILVTEPVLLLVRKELRTIAPDVKIETDQIREVLLQEVIKREVVEGEKADAARKKLAKASKQKTTPKKTKGDDIVAEEVTPSSSVARVSEDKADPNDTFILNDNEKRILAALAKSPSGLHLSEMAASCFPELADDKANSWARNAVRRPLNESLIEKIADGTYMLTTSGRQRMQAI